jgi:hypothetical protein
VNISTSELITINSRGQRVVALNNLYGGVAGTLILSKAVADRLGIPANAPAAVRIKALDGLKIATSSASSAFTFSFFGAAPAQSRFRSMFLSLQWSRPFKREWWTGL